MDLAAALIQAIEEHRSEINESRIARGEKGRIEINVNPSVKRIVVNVMVCDNRHVA